jgi:hypothetical protein
MQHARCVRNQRHLRLQAFYVKQCKRSLLDLVRQKSTPACANEMCLLLCILLSFVTYVICRTISQANKYRCTYCKRLGSGQPVRFLDFFDFAFSLLALSFPITARLFSSPYLSTFFSSLTAFLTSIPLSPHLSSFHLFICTIGSVFFAISPSSEGVHKTN